MSRSTFSVETDARLTTVDVTDRVAAAIPDDLESGTATVFVEHTTAGLIVQENESRLRGDLETFLADLVPDEGHAHDAIDDNADTPPGDAPRPGRHDTDRGRRVGAWNVAVGVAGRV